MIRLLLALFLAIALPALADNTGAFSPLGNTVAFSATSTSTTTPLQVNTPNKDGTQRLIYNDGPNTAYLAWCSTVSCTAAIPAAGTPANGIPIAAGAYLTLTIPPNAFFAVVTASTKTATVYISAGQGN